MNLTGIHKHVTLVVTDSAQRENTFGGLWANRVKKKKKRST